MLIYFKNITMKKLLSFLIVFLPAVMFGQVVKTSGLIYSNGDPKTKGIDTLIQKNINKNAELVVNIANGGLYTYNRADSTFNSISRPYRVYTALLEFDGDTTHNPVVTKVFESSIDTVTWTRTSKGVFTGTASGVVFDFNNIMAFTYPVYSSYRAYNWTDDREFYTSMGDIILVNYDLSGGSPVLTDNPYKLYVYIRLYP